MKAMILAAGLGTRLQPLTLKMPKPLLPVANRPVIDRTLEYLKAFGVSQVIVNAHHLHKMVVSHFENGRRRDFDVQVRVEPVILGTGGGIKNAEDFLDESPFLVMNGDILTDIDLGKAVEAHRREGNLATMILHDHPPFNQVQMNARGSITQISPRILPDALAFTGIHVMESELLSHIPQARSSCIMDSYRKLMRDGGRIKGYVSKGHYWRDMGTVENYLLANKEYLWGRSLLAGQACRISQEAEINDWAVMGSGNVIEAGARIARSVLWDNVRVRKGVQITDSIVTSGKEVCHDIRSSVL